MDQTRRWVWLPEQEVVANQPPSWHAACFGIVGSLAVTMVYDVHFDLKPQYAQHRLEEHRTAKKLAQAQMALVHQYRDDIHESQEAGRLLKTLDTSYTEFQEKLRSYTYQ